jgi:hypothetical protein
VQLDPIRIRINWTAIADVTVFRFLVRFSFYCVLNSQFWFGMAYGEEHSACCYTMFFVLKKTYKDTSISTFETTLYTNLSRVNYQVTLQNHPTAAMVAFPVLVYAYVLRGQI